MQTGRLFCGSHRASVVANAKTHPGPTQQLLDLLRAISQRRHTVMFGLGFSAEPGGTSEDTGRVGPIRHERKRSARVVGGPIETTLRQASDGARQ